MGSGAYTKQDLVWLLRLKASILKRDGQTVAAGEFEKLVSALQFRTMQDLIRTTQVEAGLPQNIGVISREQYSL
jgi:hypothetical protein